MAQKRPDVASTIGTDDLTVIRAFCGSAVGAPDGQVFGAADLASRLGRLGSAHAVALEVLRTKRADLLDDPLMLTLVGDLSQNAEANVAALDRSIRQLEVIVRDAGGVGRVRVGRLERSDARR